MARRLCAIKKNREQNENKKQQQQHFTQPIYINSKSFAAKHRFLYYHPLIPECASARIQSDGPIIYYYL